LFLKYQKITPPIIARLTSPPTIPPAIAPVLPGSEEGFEVLVLLVRFGVPVLLVGFGVKPELVGVEVVFASKIACNAGSAQDIGYLALLE
jgi:hypothetical protein